MYSLYNVEYMFIYIYIHIYIYSQYNVEYKLNKAYYQPVPVKDAITALKSNMDDLCLHVMHPFLPLGWRNCCSSDGWYSVMVEGDL